MWICSVAGWDLTENKGKFIIVDSPQTLLKYLVIAKLYFSENAFGKMDKIWERFSEKGGEFVNSRSGMILDTNYEFFNARLDSLRPKF